MADDVDMTGKVVAITGANAGIGREAARRLAAMGATVVMTSRDPGRGAAALDDVRAGAAHPDRVELAALDLASFASIEAFAQRLLDTHDRLDVLVNNAGGVLTERQETAEGFEMTFGVNHLGHFHLTRLLLDRLRASAPARIVTTASMAHRAGSMHWADLQSTRSYSSASAYSQSKLANVLFTAELARRLPPDEVTANCCHPGVVRTGFASADDTRGLERVIVAVGRPIYVTARRGATPLVFLASSPKVAGVTGGYWVGGYVPGVHRHRPSKEARDPAAARRLWRVSEELVGSPTEPPEGAR